MSLSIGFRNDSHNHGQSLQVLRCWAMKWVPQPEHCSKDFVSLAHSCIPFLCRGKASINEGFLKMESTTKAQIFGQSRQHTPHDA